MVSTEHPCRHCSEVLTHLLQSAVFRVQKFYQLQSKIEQQAARRRRSQPFSRGE